MNTKGLLLFAADTICTKFRLGHRKRVMKGLIVCSLYDMAWVSENA